MNRPQNAARMSKNAGADRMVERFEHRVTTVLRPVVTRPGSASNQQPSIKPCADRRSPRISTKEHKCVRT